MRLTAPGESTPDNRGRTNNCSGSVRASLNNRRRPVSGWIPPSYRRLLGSDLEKVSAAQVRGLVGQPERELEFKGPMYKTTDGEKKEMALDIAQFANSAGGLIIVGMEEDKTTKVAKMPVPIDTSGPLLERVDQIVAARIHPSPGYETSIVPEEGDDDLPHPGYLLISVPPSRSQPHAVNSEGGILRYPIRSGTTRQYLTESEVADRYRRRTAAFADIGQRLDGTTQSAIETLDIAYRGRDGVTPLVPRSDDDLARIVLVVAAAPDIPGDIEMRRGLCEEWEGWLDDVSWFPSYQQWYDLDAAPGFRSIRLGWRDHETGVMIAHHGGELGLDGAGFLISGADARLMSDGSGAVADHCVVADLVNSVSLLANHAARSGALGALSIATLLDSPQAPRFGICAQARSGIHSHRSALPGTRVIAAPTPPTRRSFPIEALVDDPRELLSAVRLLAGDLLSAFGVPEPPQIDAELQLVEHRFPNEWSAHLEGWAAKRGMPIVR